MPSEMQPPPRAVPKDDAGYFEVLSKAVFQGGISWAVIEKKWPGFREAFHEFDVDAVAEFTPEDVDRLLGNAEIVRNARKIQATVKNARTIQDLSREHGSMQQWLADSSKLPWPERKKAVSKPFSHLGPMGAYFFLYSVGESVPPHEMEPDWTEPVPAGYPEAHQT